MALFDLNKTQFQELKAEISALTQAVNDLSTNVGKWQATQTTAIQSGFAGLIAAITGADIAEVQQRINALAQVAKTEADAFEQAAQRSQQSNEGE